MGLKENMFIGTEIYMYTLFCRKGVPITTGTKNDTH